MKTAFVQPSSTIRIPNGIVTVGGPTLRMPVGNGRVIAFEMHRYFGPMPMTKTGEEMIRPPMLFYSAYELWDNGGRMVDGDLCIVPEICRTCWGSGVAVIEQSSKRSARVKTCTRCNGTKIEVSHD